MPRVLKTRTSIYIFIYLYLILCNKLYFLSDLLAHEIDETWLTVSSDLCVILSEHHLCCHLILGNAEVINQVSSKDQPIFL